MNTLAGSSLPHLMVKHGFLNLQQVVWVAETVKVSREHVNNTLHAILHMSGSAQYECQVYQKSKMRIVSRTWYETSEILMIYNYGWNVDPSSHS